MISDERQQSSVHLYESRLQQAAVYRNSFITQPLFFFFFHFYATSSQHFRGTVYIHLTATPTVFGIFIFY